MQKVYFIKFLAPNEELWYAGWSVTGQMPFITDVFSNAEPLYSQRQVDDVVACVGEWADALGCTIEIVEV